MNYSEELNRLFVDPDRDETRFWNVLRAYVGRVVNTLTSNSMIDDVVQDVCIQVWSNLHRFVPDPDHGESSFSRWVTGIAKRRAMNARREVFRDRHVPVSQLSSWKDGGDDLIEPELSSYDAEIPSTLYEEILDLEVKQDRFADALDKLREVIRPKERPMLDLLRAGVSKAEAARQLGLNPYTVYVRLSKWRRLAQKHGIDANILDPA